MTKHRMNSSSSRAQWRGLQIIHANEDVKPPSAIALDHAITNVGSRELERLSLGLSDQEVAHKIETALRALDGLRRCEKPEYNDWVSLWYLLWY
ncbi:MAG: hypothetical protein F4Y88_00760, partial [Chloroflexi bacterium]|nr:hypothetical protein [Chloroflexota bacterium]